MKILPDCFTHCDKSVSYTTEMYPFTRSSEIITDITSTGATLKANKLMILKDGIILKSQACLMTPKKNKDLELLKVF